MSRALLYAKKGYLHSPVDDLESFFWVAIWSVFFNKDHAKELSDEEKSIRDRLVEGSKDIAINSYSELVFDATTSDIARRFQSVLYDWWMKVRDRTTTWSRKVLRDAPDNADGKYYLPHFHRFALEGVVDVLQVLANHWDSEIDWESWTGSTTSV